MYAPPRPPLQMKLKYFFTIVIALKCLFLAVPDFKVTPFLFPSKEMEFMSLFQYVYALFEIATLFLIVGILWLFTTGKIRITPDRSASVGAFVLMCGIDLVDFLVRGNSEWFYIRSYPVTNNVFMAICYPLLTFNLEE